jgi:butyryl-CoA dehydrogenase
VEAAANAFLPGLDQHRLQPADLGQRQPADGAWHRAAKAGVRANEFKGRWSGTMCLSEPQAGSPVGHGHARLPDGEVRERPLGPRYRLKGNKMWISSGDHELTENIVHLVLAKIPGRRQADSGREGHLAVHRAQEAGGCRGQLTGERNDVALAGLNHKLGWRGTTNTLLNFGEGKYPVRSGGGLDGARRHRLPGRQAGRGPACMFHMMNEARIGIGMAATMLGLAGYYASLDYARTAAGPPSRRGRQGRASRRCASSSTPTSSACCWRKRPTAKARWR